jgi:hypothetical protein
MTAFDPKRTFRLYLKKGKGERWSTPANGLGKLAEPFLILFPVPMGTRCVLD